MGAVVVVGAIEVVGAIVVVGTVVVVGAVALTTVSPADGSPPDLLGPAASVPAEPFDGCPTPHPRTNAEPNMTATVRRRVSTAATLRRSGDGLGRSAKGFALDGNRGNQRFRHAQQGLAHKSRTDESVVQTRANRHPTRTFTGERNDLP